MLQYDLEIEDTYNHITYETFEQILMTVPQLKSRKWKDDDIVFLFSIMYWSGLRGGEAIKLEKKDFNTKTRRITLHDTKTKVVEQAIIPMTFVAETQEYLKTKPDGPLFPGLKYLTLYRWMKKLGEVLQVPAWTTPRKKTGELTVCHAMRKSIGKNLIAGVHLAPDGGNYSIIEVSKLLRHKKPSMTEEHYLNISDESLMRRY